jgi:P-type Ca2+ transporter type 2C
MDTLGGLALSTDPPAESILDRKPDSRSSPLISLTMWKMIIGQSLLKLVVLLILHFGGEHIFSYHEAREKAQLRTMVFNTFVWMQIFNEWKSVSCFFFFLFPSSFSLMHRSNRRIDNKLNIFEGIRQNWLFTATNISMMVGQVLIVLFGGKPLQVVRLTGPQWGYSIMLGFLSIPVAVIIRCIPDSAFAKIIPPCWRSSIIDSPPKVGDERKRDWDSVLLEIHEEMKFISWIHGGRLRSCGQRRKPSGISELKLVAVMVGLIAGSIGGWPLRREGNSGASKLLHTPRT